MFGRILSQAITLPRQKKQSAKKSSTTNVLLKDAFVANNYIYEIQCAKTLTVEPGGYFKQIGPNLVKPAPKSTGDNEVWHSPIIDDLAWYIGQYEELVFHWLHGCSYDQHDVHIAITKAVAKPQADNIAKKIALELQRLCEHYS